MNPPQNFNPNDPALQQRMFGDPNFNPQNARMSDQEMKAAMSNRQQFHPADQIPPPQVQNFAELNNAKNFQIHQFINELENLKAKISEMEKRCAQLSTPQTAHPQQQALQTGPVQIVQQQPPVQQQRPPAQQQQQQQQRPPAQQGYFQPPPPGMQQPGGGGGFQPFRV